MYSLSRLAKKRSAQAPTELDHIDDVVSIAWRMEGFGENGMTEAAPCRRPEVRIDGRKDGIASHQDVKHSMHDLMCTGKADSSDRVRVSMVGQLPCSRSWAQARTLASGIADSNRSENVDMP